MVLIGGEAYLKARKVKTNKTSQITNEINAQLLLRVKLENANASVASIIGMKFSGFILHLLL